MCVTFGDVIRLKRAYRTDRDRRIGCSNDCMLVNLSSMSMGYQHRRPQVEWLTLAEPIGIQRPASVPRHRHRRDRETSRYRRYRSRIRRPSDAGSSLISRYAWLTGRHQNSELSVTKPGDQSRHLADAHRVPAPVALGFEHRKRGRCIDVGRGLLQGLATGFSPGKPRPVPGAASGAVIYLLPGGKDTDAAHANSGVTTGQTAAGPARCSRRGPVSCRGATG